MGRPRLQRSKNTRGSRAKFYCISFVDERGAVRLPAVDASPSPAFAASAVEAVKKWTFEPGKLSGRPVAVLIKVEVAFRLFYWRFH
jgi:hypothetical protein